MKMKKKEFKTIKEYFYWVYSNMAMAHVALKNEHTNYISLDYMIRARLYKGLCDGTQNISSLYSDEKDKLNHIRCSYCGITNSLTLDHIIPRYHGGTDSGDNLVYSCKSCNSSKSNKDLIIWSFEKGVFPPILVLRRYLKLAFIDFNQNHYMDLPYERLDSICNLFKINLLPYAFPPPSDLNLYR